MIELSIELGIDNAYTKEEAEKRRVSDTPRKASHVRMESSQQIIELMRPMGVVCEREGRGVERNDNALYVSEEEAEPEGDPAVNTAVA
ncbi:hypothetical protein EYF80_063134 [Liparis tanakae]|uniref:Uncharacterized protein n=1 Tax=Liparis tanakae TaxID=230148 RepID=A0A4Z2EDA9_9TELE|nr:hypothetical protein EYF80_063134 [Liparis tanakae]